MAATILSVVFVVVVVVVLPVLAIASGRAAERADPAPEWRHFFVSTVIVQGALLILALAVAWAAGITLFPAPDPEPRDAAWGGGFLVLAFAAAAVKWRLTPEVQRGRLLRLLPRTAAQRGWNLLLLALAAIGEEIVYRGVLFSIVAGYTRGWWSGAVLSAAAFAGAHAVQGWVSAVVVFFFGIAFQVLVGQTGDLYTAMAAHFIFDSAAIAVYTRIGSRGAGAA